METDTGAPPMRRPPRVTFFQRVAHSGWAWWGAAIVVFAVVPVGWLFGLTPEDAWSVEGAVAHFLEFGIFAMLVAAAWRDRVPGSTGLLPAAVVAGLFALFTELIQGPVPYRDFDLRDLAADLVGAAIGLIVLSLVRRMRGPRRPRRRMSTL